MEKNILELIGNTPIVRINRLNPNKKVNIFAKLEGQNPGGSIKDRIALKMIEQAEKKGELTKNKTIIEATSGNTGIAIAMIAAVKDYKVEIVMSDAVSVERRKMIAAFGAKITLTDGKLGTDGAIKKTRELVAKFPEKYYCPDQFSNNDNVLAHYETTAAEIWKQMNGKIDYFVASIGTSGTLMGVGRYLKKKNPRVKIVSAEPVKGHYIQGLKNMEEAIIPVIYDRSKLDDIIIVETEAAFDMARQVVRSEGIFCGMSSGAAMFASLEIAKKIKSGNIVTIFPDRGEKYLSTTLFN
ncbi:MAG: cysteine synthase A [Candidatus Moranbacteria bacterium CG_4_10_14_3_um_filter_44_15]|nr:MAG: cysteine synthase A [Candidatus Moranbacteria bacterium CG06_land_8_20_14_3_00_43_56]PIW92912.1 MAG: cysteine synthase A [Candidatus Moranbacteria bacterium CG_4_8_14_3_um_filter_43_15]PIX90594.1 MAG: cysteine synthase A [Candidatus Moranbacteria bacterium CG_4_10_14_3_um_filter_44_15]PJA86131.1 MAG: cysteine synthase A [Candidatus Moranbacteria bacterium CG_4_9_14_3_um_filter_44_28]